MLVSVDYLVKRYRGFRNRNEILAKLSTYGSEVLEFEFQ